MKRTIMTTRKTYGMQRMIGVAALILAAALGMQPVQASRMVAPQVTGRVTAMGSNTTIVVDGKRYLVAVNSAAYKALADLHVGDSVGLILNGSPGSSAAHVTAIQVNRASK